MLIVGIPSHLLLRDHQELDLLSGLKSTKDIEASLHGQRRVLFGFSTSELSKLLGGPQLSLDVEVPASHKLNRKLSYGQKTRIAKGSITIYYFAKEEPNCKFVPVYAEAFVPVKVSFQKGHAQRFKQPPGTGIDLGFFELDALSKPSSGEDVYPLVICAEINVPLVSPDEHHYVPLPNTATTPHMQITQAVLEKNNDNPFKVKVMRQILWIDGVRYELREIYGISQSEEKFDDAGSGEECVICLTEPKNTAVLPCRHMCLCSECAKALRDQTNKCPICRQPIEELMEIKINTNDR
ncbi:probable E3 ubiquitin-protein ligase LUL4 [Tanacetum coccineum]